MAMPANDSLSSAMRGQYQRRMLEIRGAFEAGGASGAVTIAARATAVDDLVRGLWARAVELDPWLRTGVALVAIGGYGRGELFPYSDVDLLFLLDGRVTEKDVKEAVRRVNQELWDSGIRSSPITRRAAECERFDAENAEGVLSLMDHRLVTGDGVVYEVLAKQCMPKLLQRESKAVMTRLMELTRARHGKYGDTLFHLEPNIKDCPGGLRDAHVCGWMAKLFQTAAQTAKKGSGDAVFAPSGEEDREFRSAVEFLWLVRCFLHYRHERDDNTLDWQAQDAAAETMVGLTGRRPKKADAAYWMRFYFRHARSVERRVEQVLDEVPLGKTGKLLGLKRDRKAEAPWHGFRVERGRVVLQTEREFGSEPAEDPDVVLQVFETMAQTGCRLGREAEERLSDGLPLLSAHLEEGPALWHRLRGILTGFHAGDALRSMHALGVLELLIPEFHGIDALVIRDAYHRYTVDEHTFVLIDTLHGLEAVHKGPMAEWAGRFGGVLRELPHPELLYLAALLHDTGKGRSGDHARESARMTESVMARLELDSYESGLVVGLIANHLEMSAALRRDIFDAETVRAFAGKVHTPEALRMLTLFTYADIDAVHPDALTPWKAENLWQLYIATANYLDRSVDDERVSGGAESELVHRVVALLPGQKAAVGEFLEGFPERYVLTRTPEQVRTHFGMARRLEQDSVQLEFRHAPAVSELTVVTRDRPQLFATIAGVLAAWGMNIVTADAFSNRQSVVVDTFRFTDTFRTLEMNASEHEVFVKSVHDVLTGAVALEKLLSGRRRGRKKTAMVSVETQIGFDDEASSHSTLVQVVAQDTTGLLRALSLTLAARGCNIEVALVDTEGETAIDVFYLTKSGAKLDKKKEGELRKALEQAIEENAQ
ncbi:MAG TPA: [protein-PII] uridylyltransferase [Edaphobacter sp.]|jgi:[protein-PII] uridylyltransferase|nr:[protein-PII] uridylyltransferase [Edaphobacter sp.]